MAQMQTVERTLHASIGMGLQPFAVVCLITNDTNLANWFCDWARTVIKDAPQSAQKKFKIEDHDRKKGFTNVNIKIYAFHTVFDIEAPIVFLDKMAEWGYEFVNLEGMNFFFKKKVKVQINSAAVAAPSAPQPYTMM